MEEKKTDDISVRYHLIDLAQECPQELFSISAHVVHENILTLTSEDKKVDIILMIYFVIDYTHIPFVFKDDVHIKENKPYATLIEGKQ